jgi:gluconolactonase
VTLPESIGGAPVSGATVVFECVFDDYAEVWVNGRLPTTLGGGGATVAGWNAPNRVVLTREASPGQVFDVAVFVANGPMSDPPSNYIWARSATLDVYAAGRDAARAQRLRVKRADPALDEVIAADAVIETLAEGFVFGEGPVWVKDLAGGSLLFSDPNQNVIHRWSEDDGVTVFRTKSGYSGADIGVYRQAGSNGLALDGQGRLTICEHGNRRVTRLEPNGVLTVLADRFEGKRLNSPNDLVYRSDGALYFTDPPFGLPKFHEDPRRESRHTGVYCLREGVLRLVGDELTGPNGLAFSPDEKFLYVANWDTSRKVVMRYEAAADGTLEEGTVFFDMTSAPGEEALDGVKVDRAGNVFVSGPGGVWIISPAGKHLGTIESPNLPANFAWGGRDGRDLYLTARSSLYRVRVKTGGLAR